MNGRERKRHGLQGSADSESPPTSVATNSRSTTFHANRTRQRVYADRIAPWKALRSAMLRCRDYCFDLRILDSTTIGGPACRCHANTPSSAPLADWQFGFAAYRTSRLRSRHRRKRGGASRAKWNQRWFPVRFQSDERRPGGTFQANAFWLGSLHLFVRSTDFALAKRDVRPSGRLPRGRNGPHLRPASERPTA